MYILPTSGADLSKKIEWVGAFIESDFPFLSTTLDLRNLTPDFPAENLSPRGIVIPVNGNTWACFDPDLLRIAGIWRGTLSQLKGMAHTSYQDPGKKADAGQNNLTRPTGDLLSATGRIPGVGIGPFIDHDPRVSGADGDELGRGPLPVGYGRFDGIQIGEDSVRLKYKVGQVSVWESYRRKGSWLGQAMVRSFRFYGQQGQDLYIVLGQYKNSRAIESVGHTQLAFVFGDVEARQVSVEILQTSDRNQARLTLEKGDYETLCLRVAKWTGEFECSVRFTFRTPDPASKSDSTKNPRPDFSPIEVKPYKRWRHQVQVEGVLGQSDSVYPLDTVPLPFPNPWNRNVRPCAIDFFKNGRAAVSTFEGDVWFLDGLDAGMKALTWSRFASGFAEPMGLVIRNDELYVFSRAGITRLRDLNGDGEADFYESFCDLPVQSAETREFPMDMKLAADGSFYLAKGGIHQEGKAFQNGTILHVAPDGRSCRVIAEGLREPFIGVDPMTGIITASDQQGHEVPSTPIYRVERGDYFGFHWANHRQAEHRPIKKPIAWIPHFVDNSGAAQVWLRGANLGPLNNQLIHLSYGRPALFQVFMNSVGTEIQGGVMELPVGVDIPLLQGRIQPGTGLLFLCGFQIYGSNARELAGIRRLRYSGKTDNLPRKVEVFREGIRIEFAHTIETDSSTRVSGYQVLRWNYKRTLKYGSPHYRLNGETGQEIMRVANVRLSNDSRSVFLTVPGMREVMQMALHMDLRDSKGKTMKHSIYLTANDLPEFRDEQRMFPGLDFTALNASGETMEFTGALEIPASVEQGERLYQTMGCMACHSVDGTVEGRTGPTWKGLYGSVRELQGNTRKEADVDYLRLSIQDPDADRLTGYDAGMPSYKGILTPQQVESLVLYIQSVQ